MPAGSGPQNTHHQVPYRLVASSHVLSILWTFPSNYNFSGKTKIFSPSRTCPDIDLRNPSLRSAVSQTTFLPNRPPTSKFILGSIRRSEALATMEETKYSDDERWEIYTWLFRRKPFPPHLSRDDALYADIVQALTDMGHERSASGIRQMLEAHFESGLTQERVVDELRVLYERQPDNWDAPLAGIEPPGFFVLFISLPMC